MRRSVFPRSSYVFVFAAALFWSACSDQSVTPSAPDLGDGPLAAVVTVQELGPALQAQTRHTPDLMSTPGVVATGVGLDDRGRPAIHVYAMPGHAQVAARLDGMPVRVILTDAIVAHQQVPQAKPCASPPCNKGGGGVDLTARFDRPVPIGVSTGHPAITAGTLGARVTDGTNVYALSNNHVYADENTASIGDDVIQPGTFDGGSSPADDIGTLADFEPIVFSGACVNTIDAAIAATTTSQLGNSTPDGFGYGTPRSTIVAPALNMKVMKVGRTTGFTKGTIQSINATVNIGYDTGVACFTGQIITNAMSAGGDSGSLLVAEAKGRNKADNRKPVGLLYAGSSSITIHNPIGAVLTRFGVTIDGN